MANELLSDVCEICGLPYDGRLHFHNNTFDESSAYARAVTDRLLGVFAKVPTQYALLHAAHTLAVQLEQAGLPEAETVRTETGAIFATDQRTRREGSQFTMLWPDRAVLYIHSDGECCYPLGEEDDLQYFRIGDPLPDALVAAIRATVA